MAKLSDLLIISDVDGTLVTKDGTIPDRNIEALNRFTGKGGRFAMATGRSIEWTVELTELLPVNGPCVLYNGGVLYDFVEKSFLMALYLPETATSYIQAVLAAFPDTQVLPVALRDHLADEEMGIAGYTPFLPGRDWREIPFPWFKVLFGFGPGLMEQYEKFLNNNPFPGVRCVFSHPRLIEMLPEQSSKGYALERLITDGYVKRENIVAIGDYYNDQEMINLAGLGVTLAHAPEDLKAQADLVVGNCEDGALADLVEYLEARYE